MNYNINTIKAQVIDVLKYSQELNDEDFASIDKLLTQWETNKQPFIKKFGGLIHEFGEVTFDLDESSRATNLAHFIESNYYLDRDSDFFRFMYAQREGFYENKVIQSYVTRNGEIIPEGMKILKAAKFFLSDENELRAFQDAASRLIQETKITGTLCISVHPLDYLSVSENTYNWRSCHALDGEFRTGNINYMADTCTVVCYLKGSNNVILPRFPNSVPWNNKKWRVLLYFAEGQRAIFAGKQYPFFNPNALEYIRQGLMSDKIGLYFKDWSNTIISEIFVPDSNGVITPTENNRRNLYDRYVYMLNRLFSLNKMFKEEEDTYHFNDVLHSSTYLYPYFCTSYYSGGTMPKFHVGEAVDCLRCGRAHIKVSDSLFCDDCELDYGHSQDERYGTCACCGSRVVWDDTKPVLDSYNDYAYVCEDCYEKYNTCDKCGIRFEGNGKICGCCAQ